MESMTILRAIAILIIFISVKFTAGHFPNDESNGITTANVPDVAIKYIGRQADQNSTSNTTCEVEDPLGSFPEDLFTDEQRANGAFILHLVGAIYCFTFLACLCNYYFLPAVECICEDFNIPKDVAAAIVMATASSLPDLFTNSISTLITDSDMGVGSIIGSLMFNTLGVASVAGMAVSKPIQLDWWPVCRDCVIYTFHLVVLMIVTWGNIITFAESGILVILCILYYCTIIISNYKMKNQLRTFVEDRLNCCISTRYDFTIPAEDTAKGKLPFHKKHNDRRQSGIYVITPTEFSASPPVYPEKAFPKDEEKTLPSSPFRLPRGSLVMKFWWVYSWPIRFLLTCTCPNPITYRRLVPITFIICVIYLGINSYMVVWMLTTFGFYIGVPDVVMGLTILAAGSATPEAFSSAVSVRRGESGIGVSNAIGANSLSIVLSLGLPWFIKIAMTDGAVIYVSSEEIELVVGILILSTLTLFFILAISGFRLGRTVGFALFVAYLVYITLQVLIELNVFFPSSNEC